MSFLHPLQRGYLLTLENPWYRHACQSFWQQQLLWDGNDITMQVLSNMSQQNVEAVIVAKSCGTLAGISEATFFLEHESLSSQWKKKDGDSVSLEDEIVRFSGSAEVILRVERILLNFLSRLSGVATNTKKLVDKIPKDILLCATRKTLWGPLDKRAVFVGGGGTHRLGLFDAVMVKDNHLALFSGNIETAAKAVYSTPSSAFWEIEVDTEEQFHQLFRVLPEGRPGGILFDNFSPIPLQNLLKNIKKPEGIFFEASGGITPDNIQEFAKCGIDAISSGMLTNSAHALDFSLSVLS
ncbi:carboxylating nicotinate-nucleotide diphosphorylase [Candidatus Peregrinibacteria bacterium]|nr:MAG: carboxylating nicotinate-nucleotide diphosphorylase [Candidatus Peregrinibacteria bacterium]